MGGEVGITSTVGVGSEFWFTINMGVGKALPVRSVIHKLAGLSVLIVDDNLTNLDVLSSQLRAQHIKVTAASSGKEALTCMRKASSEGTPFPVAILDMLMPNMDGKELSQMIAADETLNSTKLILLSSSVRRGDSKQALASGFSAFLAKPVRQSDLYDTLATVYFGEDVALEESETADQIEDTTDNGRSILLVEDNLTNQLVAKSIARKLGYQIEIANNGQEAIDILSADPYDLVLMDIQMPILDGYQTTAVIRDPSSSVQNHKIPIVAMTAHAMQGDRDKCLDAGMDDYLTKPIRPQELSDSLSRWLPVNEHIESTTDDTIVIFDYEELRNRLMEDDDLVKEVVTSYLGDLPQQIDELESCIAAGNAENILDQAHKIKGSSSNVGGIALSNVAHDMEQLAKSGQLSQISELLAQLKAQEIQLRSAMEELLN